MVPGAVAGNCWPRMRDDRISWIGWNNNLNLTQREEFNSEEGARSSFIKQELNDKANY